MFCHVGYKCVAYLGFVSHGTLAQHRDLGAGLLLQTLDRVALRSQDLPHKIELNRATKRSKISLTIKVRAPVKYQEIEGAITVRGLSAKTHTHCRQSRYDPLRAGAMSAAIIHAPSQTLLLIKSCNLGLNRVMTVDYN